MSRNYDSTDIPLGKFILVAALFTGLILQTPEVNASTSESIESVWLDVAPINQNPELYNGCEVTSMSMLLAAAGNPIDKRELADLLDKDSTPMVTSNGEIIFWGDPNKGFVGNMEGLAEGYGVYHAPIARLLDDILPGHAVDLTGESFDRILETVADNRPVMLWTNDHFSSEDEWKDWDSDGGLIHATLNEHVILLVGYDQQYLYVNDPQDGMGSKPVPRDPFIESWLEMGSQAVTFRL